MNTTLKETLQGEHQRHKELFDTLLNRVHVGDAQGSQQAWTAFERALASHLELEEEQILPLFERKDAEEAALLRTEHDKIRGLVAELGLGLDIHTVREEKVSEFLQFLESHAKREDQLMYAWASEELPDIERQTLFDRIKDALASGVEAIRHAASNDKIL